MKKPIHRLLLLVLLLSFSSLAFAGPITTYSINFEQLTSFTMVTNQYAADDVTFSNALQLVEPDGNYSAFPPHSGTGDITDAGFGTDSADSIVLTFSTGMATVSGWYADPDGVVVTAYDSAGNVIATFNGAGVSGADDEFQIFDTSGLDPIASITIGDAQDNIFNETVDDVSFTTTPEPESFLLLGTGLLGLAGVLRRKLVR